MGGIATAAAPAGAPAAVLVGGAPDAVSIGSSITSATTVTGTTASEAIYGLDAAAVVVRPSGNGGGGNDCHNDDRCVDGVPAPPSPSPFLFFAGVLPTRNRCGLF